jgi:hypothetical protein
VFSGDIQNRFAQLLAAPINAKDRSKITQLDVSGAIVGLFRKAE